MTTFPGKPGNVREFDSCLGNVRDFTKSQGSVREKILWEKSGIFVSCIFVSILDFAEFVHFILVLDHALLHSYPITDNNTGTGMIWVTLDMDRSAANRQRSVMELSGNFTLPAAWSFCLNRSVICVSFAKYGGPWHSGIFQLSYNLSPQVKSVLCHARKMHYRYGADGNVFVDRRRSHNFPMGFSLTEIVQRNSCNLIKTASQKWPCHDQVDLRCKAGRWDFLGCASPETGSRRDHGCSSHSASSCINSITHLGLPGTRDRGRPRKTWSACVRNDLTICDLDGVNPLDRNSWRMSVRHCQVLPTPESGTTAAPQIPKPDMMNMMISLYCTNYN